MILKGELGKYYCVLDGCEVRLCDPCACMLALPCLDLTCVRPCVPFFPAPPGVFLPVYHSGTGNLVTPPTMDPTEAVVLRLAEMAIERERERETPAAMPIQEDELKAAIRAQDRDKIREILAARAGPEPVPEPVDNEVRRQIEVREACTCPICHELLYKPTVNSCGHTFCFWCTHHSMDALAASSCPLCRAPFQHLPAPCLPIHQHVHRAFSTEAARRDAEMLERETSEFKASSPTLPVEISGEPDWRCVGCGELPSRPLVSVCGHLICTQCEAHARSSASLNNRHAKCPRCEARLVSHPKVCRTILTILGLDGDVHEEEIREIEEARAPISAAGSSADPAVGSKSATGSSAAPAEIPYVFFGIGCDGCGEYPILGSAFRCCDCPEAIGYDLCGACHGAPLTSGRFGQAHRPEHRLEERPQERGWLHILQAHNPTLTVHQILQLAQYGFAADPDDEEDEDDAPSPMPSPAEPNSE